MILAKRKKTIIFLSAVLTLMSFALSSCKDGELNEKQEQSSLSSYYDEEVNTENNQSEALSADDMLKSQALQAAVEDYMTDYDFSGAIVITIGGTTLCEYACGFADKSNATPNTVDTKIELGSITKQFTAAGIMMLQEQGKLSVGDTVDMYIPEYDFGSELTLENLLNMTSGIPDYLNSMIYLDAVDEIDMLEPVTFDDVLSFANSNGLSFVPGSQYKYSNTNYMMLGEIIARLSGVTYEKFIEDNILTPLGMTNTTMNMNKADAVGYLIDGSEGDGADTTYFGAAGEIASSARDLAKWLNGFTNLKVVNQQSFNSMLSDGGMGYGYGWFISDNGYYWHTGQSMACYTMDLIDTVNDVDVIVLSNVDDEAVGDICTDLYNVAMDTVVY